MTGAKRRRKTLDEMAKAVGLSVFQWTRPGWKTEYWFGPSRYQRRGTVYGYQEAMVWLYGYHAAVSSHPLDRGDRELAEDR